MKNIMLCLALMLVSMTNGIAQAGGSGKADGLIDSFFDLRMELTSMEDTDQIIGAIDSFWENNSSQIKGLGQQEQLVMEAFCVMERYNYLYQLPGQDKVQHEELGKIRAKMEEFRGNKDNGEFSKYFLCTQADVTSCYMGYSVADVMKYGKSLKPLYESAVEKDPSFSYGLTNLAQYNFWAPGIAGGSKQKAIEYCKRAYDAASTTSQKFFAGIFYSQMLYETGKKDQCSQIMKQVQQLQPQSLYVRKILDANSQGMSLFEYNKKNSKLSKE